MEPSLHVWSEAGICPVTDMAVPLNGLNPLLCLQSAFWQAVSLPRRPVLSSEASRRRDVASQVTQKVKQQPPCLYRAGLADT